MEVFRPASINERRFLLNEGLGVSHCVITIGRYTSTFPMKGQLDNFITKALQYCVEEHPVLKTIVEGAGSDHPQLAQLDSVNLDDHVEYVKIPVVEQNEQQQIKGLLDYLHNTRLHPAGKRPQWRVCVNKCSDSKSTWFYLAFVFSHALQDGMSGFVFQNTFLRAMNGAERRPDQSTKPPFPATESAGKLTISWSYLLSIVSQTFIPAWLARALGLPTEDLAEIWTGSKTRHPPKLEPGFAPTLFEVVLIEKPTLQRALKICRMHHTRLTSLLNYLVARAMSKSLRERGQSYNKFKVGIAIDLRRALGKGQGEMVNWVSALIETVNVTEHDDGSIPIEAWEAMKKSSQRLADASNTLIDQPIGLIKYIPNLRKFTERRVTEPSTVSFGMSNLGVFDGTAQRGGWQVDTAVLSQSADVSGAPFNVNVASANNGSLVINTTWWPGILGIKDERSFIREILDETQRELEMIN